MSPGTRNKGIYQDNKYLYKQFNDLCNSMGCQLGNHGFSYLWSYIIDRGAFNSVFNDKQGHKNGIMSYFQTKVDFVYSLMVVWSVFEGIVTNWYSHWEFDIIILVRHLEWWYGMPWVTCLVYLIFRLNSGYYIFVTLELVALSFILTMWNDTF